VDEGVEGEGERLFERILGTLLVQRSSGWCLGLYVWMLGCRACIMPYMTEPGWLDVTCLSCA